MKLTNKQIKDIEKLTGFEYNYISGMDTFVGYYKLFELRVSAKGKETIRLKQRLIISNTSVRFEDFSMDENYGVPTEWLAPLGKILGEKNV